MTSELIGNVSTVPEPGSDYSCCRFIGWHGYGGPLSGQTKLVHSGKVLKEKCGKDVFLLALVSPRLPAGLDL